MKQQDRKNRGDCGPLKFLFSPGIEPGTTGTGAI